MCKVIMIGCDLHDATMALKVADGPGESVRKGFMTANRAGMITWIKDFAAQRQATRIVFAYEASGLGFGLYDDLIEAGVECHVLAPTHLPHNAHSRKNKTDDKDAEMLLEEVRAHVLAGRKLPDVWIPDHQTRDDREVVRQRQRTADDRTRVKNQIRSLAKRTQLAFPAFFSSSGEWSKKSVQWLRDVAAGKEGQLKQGARMALKSLIELYGAFSDQIKQLDQAVMRLSQTERYRQLFRRLDMLQGVGLQTAMVFLTELGDLARFANRRQLAAYLGLTPAAFESGKRNDRKGHITRQGPARLRKVLCQAAWAAVRLDEAWRTKYQRIQKDSKKRNKIAIVAVMRQLAVTMWQTARSSKRDQLFQELDALRAARDQRKRSRAETDGKQASQRRQTSARAQRKALAKAPVEHETP
jgi:transposase